MPFATFNSKPPSATLDVVSGRLDGTDRTLVAFNCLTRIAVFEQSSTSGELVFVEDIPLHCSLKYMKIVPIMDADTHRTVRHVLFLLSMKQEIVLATLEQTGAGTVTISSSSSSGGSASHARVTKPSLRLAVLYQSGFEDCLHQFNPGEVSLACATGEHCRTPLVAFAVNRGDLYFLDVLAALASRAAPTDSQKKKKSSALEPLHALFPPSVVSAVEARKTVTPISRMSFDFTERDVKDISFGSAAARSATGTGSLLAAEDDPISSSESSPTAGSLPPAPHAGQLLPPATTATTTAAESAPAQLLVLFADMHGRCHVSRYSYSTSVSVSAQPSSSSSALFSFSRDVLCDSAARAVREGMVQSNVDPSAAFLSVTANGLFVLGNHLVTYLGFRPARRRAITCELPPSPSGNAVLSCVCSTGTTGSSREESLMVCFSDGVCGRISVTASDTAGTATTASMTASLGAPSPTDVSVSLDSGVGHHAPHVSIQFFLHVLPTVPTAIASVNSRFCVVASRFSDSLFIDLHTGATTVALKNCGPILDMEVVRDGPRASVVASTGVNGNGGVSLVRSAVTFQEETVVELPDHVVAAHTSGHLIALTMRDGGPRFFCAVQGTAASICEVTHLMPAALAASHNTVMAVHGEVRERSVRYTIATRQGLFAVQEEEEAEVSATSSGARVSMTMQATSPFAEEAVFASICGRCCAVAGDASADIRLYRDVTESCRAIPVPSTSCYLSALHLATETLMLYGDWRQEAVHVLELNPDATSSSPVVVSERCVRLSSVPRSLCALGRRLFAGLLNGSVVEVAADSGAVVQQAVVSHLPVELCVLPGQTDTLLCRGPVPLLLLLKESFQVTGLSTTSATACSTLTLAARPSQAARTLPKARDAQQRSVRGRPRTGRGSRDADADEDAAGDAHPGGAAVPTLVIWSREDRELVLGSVEQTQPQKLNQTFFPLHGTVTHIADVPQWDAFAVSVRRPEKDEVLLVPHSFVTNSGILASPLLTPSAEDSLLENERCVFFEPLHLSTTTTSTTGSSSTSTGANVNSLAVTSLSPSADVCVDDPAASLLVGSTFVFPDEQRARSSRIAWFRCTPAYASSAGHHATTTTTAGLQLVGEKDISGALQCCCVVPNYPGRIALGVSGCILTFHWSAVDATFVAEERCHVGLSLTKLIPLAYPVEPSPPLLAGAVLGGAAATHPESAAPMVASMVALDARHSATYVHVDPVQGSVKVVGRDGKVRGIVDGTCVLPAGSSGAGGLCVVDDSLNLLHVEYRRVDRARGDRAGDGDGHDNQGTGAASANRPARACVVTTAQAHMGDLITCLCPGSLAPSILSDSALAPSTLIKGIVGQQMVFGTAHGAVGTITPLSATTHVFLRALEASLRRVVPAPGGFQHGAFREILVTGQERGASRNASFDVPLLQKIAQERRNEEAARSCVDGDYVEGFLLLAADQQRKVLRLAEVYLLGWTRLAPPLADRDGDTVAAVDSDAYPSDAPFPEATGAVQADEQSTERCNDLLREDDLPLLPLDAHAVCAFLHALEWVH